MTRPERLRPGRVLVDAARVWGKDLFLPHALVVAIVGPVVALPWLRDEPLAPAGAASGALGLLHYGWHVAGYAVMLAEQPASRQGAGLLVATAVYFGQLVATALLVRRAHRRLAPAVRTGGAIPFTGVLAFGVAGAAAFLLIDVVGFLGLRGAERFVGVFGILLGTVAKAALASVFWLALACVAVDRERFDAALARSRRLTGGSRFAVFALLVTLLAGLVAALVPVFIALDEPESLAGILAVAVPLISFKSCVLAAAYRELCLAKEGLRPEELGEVFA